MSANPPILSIPAQSPDPVSHINTFPASLAPHVSEHAAIGTREFGNQRPQSRDEEGWRGRANSLDVGPGQRERGEGSQREDFRLTADAREGSARFAFQRSRRRTLDGSLPRIITTPQAVRVARHSDPNRLPVDRDMGAVSPTESARRRHARKMRRREKAAILNARPPPSPAHSAHAHPAPKRRSSESDSEAGRALSEILSGERRAVGGRGKRRKMQPGMDLIRRWKPENVVTSRLTMRPGTKGLKGGILGKAKTSLPIRAPYWGGSKAEQSDRKRRQGIEDSEDEMHLWHRRPEQRRRSQGRSTPAPDTSQRIPSRAFRSSSCAFEQESRNAMSSTPRPTRYDRLPSAGITNSPSWPSFTTHQRSDPPVIPAHPANVQVAPQSSTGSMGYRDPFSSLAHSSRSTRPAPHTGVRTPPFAHRPERETWETGGRQPKPVGSQPAHRRQPEYHHPLQHIDDLSSSFAQHLGMPQTTLPPRNGKSPLYPIRRTIYGQLLPRDHASSVVKTMSSSPLFQPRVPTIPFSPIRFGEPSDLRALKGSMQPVGDTAGSRSGAARQRDRGDVHVRVDLSSSPIRSMSEALPLFNTDSSPISIRIPAGGRRDHQRHSHAFESIVDTAVRRSQEFTEVDRVAHPRAAPSSVGWDGAYGSWEEYRDDVTRTGVDQAGQTDGQMEEGGQGLWRTDGMGRGASFSPIERVLRSLPGEELQWNGIGNGGYEMQARGARGDNDVHMNMGTDIRMGMGTDIGAGGMGRGPPLQWQQLNRGTQEGRSTLHTEDDQWKRFWQRRNDG
ncbi:hypothetical protein JCM24511_05663 [Saitozyma sp. JCM 24511]|nr:hypothetical protein JCM24511_05663 [Saitozyma sp. JCM 24511]